MSVLASASSTRDLNIKQNKTKIESQRSVGYKKNIRLVIETRVHANIL